MDDVVARPHCTSLSAVALAVSTVAAAAVWRELTSTGFMPYPALLVPLLCLAGLGSSIWALRRSHGAVSKILSATGLVLSLGATAGVVLMLIVVALYLEW